MLEILLWFESEINCDFSLVNAYWLCNALANILTNAPMSMEQ